MIEHLTRQQYLSLAARHKPKVCGMTIPVFGGKADMTLGFDDTKARGTWSVQFARALFNDGMTAWRTR